MARSSEERAARRARCRVGASLALGLAAGAVSGSARADESSPESVRLFADARRLMAEKKYDQACPELERSDALDPEIGTEFNLARCYELAGRLASAWTTYGKVIEKTRAAGQGEREAVARSVAAALAPRVAHVVVQPARGAAVEGLEVRCDGMLVGEKVWGEARPIDPGRHVVEAVAPGRAPWWQVFVVDRDGQKFEIEVPLLSPPRLASPLSPVPPAAEPRLRSTGRTQREIAAVFGGAALVGAGIGTYYGLRAASLSSQSNAICDTVCQPAGFALRDEAQRDGNVATVAFTIAVSLAVEAAVIWLTAPPAGRSQPAVRP